jgi:YggT family protein
VRAVALSIGGIISNIIQLISLLVLVWCLLSWFPNIRWYDQPWKTLDRIVQPIMAPFRKILPPINGIDLSPMIAMMVLQFVSKMVSTL